MNVALRSACTPGTTPKPTERVTPAHTLLTVFDSFMNCLFQIDNSSFAHRKLKVAEGNVAAFTSVTGVVQAYLQWQSGHVLPLNR